MEEKMREKLREKLKREGKTFKWFWENYIQDVATYTYFSNQLNNFATMQPEVRSKINRYLSKLIVD